VPKDVPQVCGDVQAMSWIGLDVGGANLKLATAQGEVRLREFPLWKQAAALPEALAGLLAGVQGSHLAVTMTGELADCYRTKREGVDRILQAVESAWRGPIWVYSTDGRWLLPQQARQEPLQVAAANWHALARLAAQWAESPQGLLLDVGSTTTDLIPWDRGKPCPRGRTDPQRLASGELVYLGVKRTPLCAVVQHLPWQGRQVPVAAEWFATTWDVYLLLGLLPPEEQATGTADGRPAVPAEAHFRLARQICADGEMLSLAEAKRMARFAHQQVMQRLLRAWKQVHAGRKNQVPAVVLSGAGEFLARELLRLVDYQGRVVAVSEVLGQELSTVAPAYAVACLAQNDAPG